MADYISTHSGLEIDSAVSAVADKVDKVTGKDLSTNDLTNELLTLLTTNKVKSIATDALNGKLVVTYTDDTVANLNINDIVTDVYVSGATLDATTNVLTLTSTSGGADVIVDLSTFVNSDEIMNYYTKDETDAIHESLVTTSVGQSVSYFLGDTIVSGGNYDLTTYPDGDVETAISITAVNANTSYFMERYISDPVGGTTIDGGIWVFRTYASVNSATGISEIVCRINKRTAKTGTITTTGTGLTRTVTSTEPIFVVGDADASILNASLIETLTETFWISTYVSATQVTITLSSDTYVNETAVPFYMYYKLFEASTGEINATVATLYEANSIQPEFVILPEDSILIAYFARTTSTNKTIRIYKGGAEHYSHIVTPLVYRHNNLKGLNDGDYQHLTETQLTKLNTIESIALTITNKTIDDITNSIGADHIHYKVRNNTASTITKGTVVKATGSQPGTDYITIEPTASTSDVGIGIVHSNILSNGVGLVVNTGEAKNINTSAWTVGTILYTAAGGTFTTTKPTTGSYQASAYVLRQHATQGVLLVEFSEPVYISSTTQSGYVQLNNTLTSTSTTQALTAAQGKVLQDGKAPVVHTHDISAINTTGYPTIRPSLSLDFANSKVVDSRITFTRASSGTIYNEDGLIESVASGVPRITHNPVTGECEGLLIEESRTNLLTHSNQFDNAAWSKLRVSLNNNTTAALDPYGTYLAIKITEDTSSTNSHIVTRQTIVSAQQYTHTIYAKAAERSWVAIQGYTGALNATAYFNLATGVVGSAVNGTSNIQSIGSGWYRCSLTYTVTTGVVGSFAIYIATGDGVASYTGDGVSGLYIYGAQLEAGGFPTSYIPSANTFTSRASTATYYNSAGLLASAPIDTVRMNYNPTNLKVAPSMLLEGASTNLLTYSEDFGNAAWMKIRATTSANTTATTDPYGTVLADKLVEDTTLSNTHQAYQFYTYTATTYTYSVYLKAAERAFAFVKAFDGAVDHGGHVNLASGTIGNTTNITASSINYIDNGWYRVSFTFVANAGNGNVAIFLEAADGNSVYNGDGTSGLYIWGAQLEALPYATSYIPTTTAAVTRAADVYTSAASTRAADVAYMDGANFSDWYRQDEGSFVVDWKNNINTRDNNSLFSVTNTNGVVPVIAARVGYADFRRVRTYSQSRPGTFEYTIDYPSTATDKGKSSLAILSNSSMKLSCDGGTITEDTTGFISAGAYRELRIGKVGLLYLNGSIKHLAYYPKRLTNTELQALSI